MKILKSVFMTLLTLLSVGAVAQTNEPDYYRLKVMSYNILHGVNAQNKNQLTTQALDMKEANAAVIGLQEVDNKCRRSGSVDQMSEFAKLLNMKSAFGKHYDYQGGEYGLGILSLYPLTDIKNDKITLLKDDGTTSTLALLSAIVNLPNDEKIRFVTVHFGLKAENRLMQAKEVLDKFKDEKIPVILTGDLNAEPDSPEIKLLETAYVNTGTKNNFTFPVGRPKKTIDYIMINQLFHKQTAGSVVRYDAIGSDHYPLVSDILIYKADSVKKQ